MRLFRLDLTRYGKFTDHRIDFGPREPGRPDLHIVYGPNEAGKSTSLAAFLDVLFGIETRSRYDFLHPYATMRIGAALELDGTLRELVRIKRPQNSLLDGDGQPVAARIMLGELGGIDRDAYRTMFSLDDETLEAGGNSILASRGDLGQLLFSASSGLADLSQTLLDLQEETDKFYKFRARNSELLELKDQLQKLKDRRDHIDTLASTHAQLVATRDTVAAQYDKAIAERRVLQARMDAIQRQRTALPRLATLRRIREDLLPLAGLPEAPLHWAKDLPALQKQEIELATRQEGVKAEILRLSAAIDGISIDEAALAMADRVDRLAGPRARHVTAEKDLPERRLRLRHYEHDIADLLRRLDRESEADPASLVLGASLIGALQGLMEQRSGVETGLKAAANEWAEAEQRLAEARRDLETQEGRVQPGQDMSSRMGALAAIVKALRGDDHATRRRAPERARTGLLNGLGEQMRLLRPWEGDVEELAQLSVPERSEIDIWKAAEAKAQKAIDRRADEVERFGGEARRLKAEMDAIGAVTGILDDQQAALIRRAREDAWALHRRQLDRLSADAFEDLLRRDDIATNARFAHAQDVARLHQVARAVAIASAGLAAEEQRLAAAASEHGTLRGKIAAKVEAMAARLPADLPLAQLEIWLARREKALEMRAALRQTERELDAAEADGALARSRLAEALADLGVTADAATQLDGLLTTAQSLIDRSAERKRLLDRVAEREADEKRRRSAFERAARAEQDWTAAWEKLCAGCWLGRNRASPTTAEAREILRLGIELGSVLKARFELGDRIEKMEKDQKAFAGAVTAIACGLGIVTDEVTIETLDHAISARLARARADDVSRAETRARLIEAEARLAALSEAITIKDRRKAEMTIQFGVDTLAEVETRLRMVDRKAELSKRLAEAERDIVEALDVPELGAAETILDSVDRVALEDEFAESKGRFDDSDQRTRELFTAHSRAVEQLEAIGGDAEVARLEEQRRTILLDVEERALRHMRLRVGIMAAEQALRLYRDRHRSSMLTRASGAFQTISRGAYTGLASQPDKDSEILIGLGVDGRSRSATDMSKGTRFQLYLALRVAGYHEFARSRRPVPFIADDIMETFDDFRAEEAFRLFAEMAEVGQVIYLTHHRHLCEIGTRICPGLKLHVLPSASR